MNVLTFRISQIVQRLLIFGMGVFALVLADVGFGNSITEKPYRIALVGDLGSRHVTAVMSSLEKALSIRCGDECPSTFAVSRVNVDGEAYQTSSGSQDLTIAIGSLAAQEVAKASAPVPTLYVFIPQAAWQSLSDCCIERGVPHSALFIDQPLLRQFELLKLIDPTVSRIGVLLGKVSVVRRESLIDAAESLGIVLNTATVEVSGDIGPDLRELVRRNDAILAVPDPLVFNRNTIYSILLTSYSSRVPVIGYSREMVEAGAAAAVHTTAEAVGQETAQKIYEYWQTGVMPPVGYGKRFSVTINRDVMRSLRLREQSEDALEQRLERASP